MFERTEGAALVFPREQPAVQMNLHTRLVTAHNIPRAIPQAVMIRTP